jgi:hypothetical protein
MPDSILGPAVEYHIAQMRVRVLAAKVRLTKV